MTVRKDSNGFDNLDDARMPGLDASEHTNPRQKTPVTMGIVCPFYVENPGLYIRFGGGLTPENIIRYSHHYCRLYREHGVLCKMFVGGNPECENLTLEEVRKAELQKHELVHRDKVTAILTGKS